MSLSFSQPRSWVSPAVLVLFLPAFVLGAGPLGIALGLYVLLLCAVVWFKLVAGTRVGWTA